LSAPSDPTNALLIAINSQLANKNFRDSLRKMHDANYPLVKMIEDLGLEEDMSPALRMMIENLAPDVVDGIRRATLDMLDRGEHMLPVSWDVTDSELHHGANVEVDVVETEDGRVIRVRPDRRAVPC
jgi:hypothetical protein